MWGYLLLFTMRLVHGTKSVPAAFRRETTEREWLEQPIETTRTGYNALRCNPAWTLRVHKNNER
jgi:hypothetical protein